MDETEEETLDAFVVRVKGEVDAFASHWKEQQTTPSAGHWPDSLPPAEWDEQLIAHLFN